MEAAEKKFRLLEIDTAKKEPKRSNRLPGGTQRYSTSFLFNVEAKGTEEKLHNHKRSASAGHESIMLPRADCESSSKGLIRQQLTNRKKWFQLPRITLKRQASTPPRAGYGGLKAGLVEPPEPPPQLLFNLAWSSNDAPLGNDVNSTPNTPTISKRSSGFNFDIIEPPIIPSLNDRIVRRQSCPNYEDNEILKKQTKLFSFGRPVLRRGVSTDGYTVTPSASSSTSSTSSIPPPSPISPCLDDFKPLFIVSAPNSDDVVLDFKSIKPRTCKLLRKVNPKIELKALNVWQTQLLISLNTTKSLPRENPSPEKAERYFLTRKFILREFYTTEINFWNQLNYTKVMFYDPLQLAVERNSDVTRAADIDAFSNLQDLMRFSSTLIIRVRNDQMERSDGNISQEDIADPDCQTSLNNVNMGLILRSMVEYMVVFLRCALDYKTNKKTLDMRLNKKAYALYAEKLALKKETRRFTLQDYLIIPIQRITRYGLLLADLEKHTETTHPDYEDIRIVRCIVESLAVAMNSVQKK
ncbi:Dbl homology domain-containing protein [Mucor mucedo]|uniref:Dbl homology domain-containing protein n=1 Tax=Mucor mucedo TaxID=29922 RepID=UPI00221EE33F|nr:Dbl homology domain-containing protein [Mucor mucedo]KAI7894925.1 Dbl homology domain-containing protein [Mucor mucedo]